MDGCVVCKQYTVPVGARLCARGDHGDVQLPIAEHLKRTHTVRPAEFSGGIEGRGRRGGAEVKPFGAEPPRCADQSPLPLGTVLSLRMFIIVRVCW